MRVAWYAGVSTALATAVVISAFHQRVNFYSAMVYLSQSNLCLIILINFVYLVYGTLLLTLQRICFGPLRATEIEQLSDRAWIAITETCLAMTIFREEIGAFFLVMFTALVTGKVWGWIGDGRLDTLDQHVPNPPRFFHARLILSLGLSVVYDVALLRYCVMTVIQQARPNMMVMFLFEFAALTTSSLRTICRYSISRLETHIVHKQTQARLAQRRQEVRRERDRILQERRLHPTEEEPREDADPELIDELDIEVPGWDAKGMYLLSLDLIADFLKMIIYLAFFVVILMFYGLPVHIMRDVYISASDFFRQLSALLKYRRAIRSMNSYPDASREDLDREDTCIICREEMRPWNPQDVMAVERTRPKKLPCGHTLHLGCLRSWLERQQVCPTCRHPVVPNNPTNGGGNGGNAGNNNNNNNNANNNNNDNGVNNNNNNQNGRPAGVNARMLNFGPLRVQFIHGNEDAMRQILGEQIAGMVNPRAPPAAQNQEQNQGQGQNQAQQAQQREENQDRQEGQTQGQARDQPPQPATRPTPTTPANANQAAQNSGAVPAPAPAPTQAHTPVHGRQANPPLHPTARSNNSQGITVADTILNDVIPGPFPTTLESLVAQLAQRSSGRTEQMAENDVETVLRILRENNLPNDAEFGQAQDALIRQLGFLRVCVQQLVTVNDLHVELQRLRRTIENPEALRTLGRQSYVEQFPNSASRINIIPVTTDMDTGSDRSPLSTDTTTTNLSSAPATGIRQRRPAPASAEEVSDVGSSSGFASDRNHSNATFRDGSSETRTSAVANQLSSSTDADDEPDSIRRARIASLQSLLAAGTSPVPGNPATSAQTPSSFSLQTAPIVGTSTEVGNRMTNDHADASSPDLIFEGTQDQLQNQLDLLDQQRAQLLLQLSQLPSSRPVEHTPEVETETIEERETIPPGNEPGH